MLKENHQERCESVCQTLEAHLNEGRLDTAIAVLEEIGLDMSTPDMRTESYIRDTIAAVRLMIKVGLIS